MVDVVGDVGSHTSLALNGLSYPHISYSDNTNADLKYAYHGGSGWVIETVDEAPQWAAMYTSLALDMSGAPHISYYWFGYDNLKYAYQLGSDWHIETVDAVGEVGSYTSLALDGSGYPHISYFDETNGDLKYAWILGPAPIRLTGSLAAGQLMLSWTTVPAAAAYWVYGMTNEPWFLPDLSPPTYVNRVEVVPAGTTTWSSPNGVDDPRANWTYLVMAMGASAQELIRSNRIGEHDFRGDIP